MKNYFRLMIFIMLISSSTTIIALDKSTSNFDAFEYCIDSFEKESDFYAARDAHYQQIIDDTALPVEHIIIDMTNEYYYIEGYSADVSVDFSLFNFDSSLSRFGINMAPYWRPFRATDFRTWEGFVRVGNSSRHAFHVEINHVLVQDSRNPQNFAFAYRVVMSPNNSTERHGFLNLLTRGDQWLNRRQNTSVPLPAGNNLGTWAPVNNPASSTTSIGVGIGPSGPSISASVNFTPNELTVISRTNVGNRRFEAEYDFDRGGWHRFWGTGASNFLRHSVVSYGFFTFHNASSNPTMEVSHQARFESQNLRYGDVILTVTSMF